MDPLSDMPTMLTVKRATQIRFERREPCANPASAK
jgi:hypothetical protein